MSNDPPSTISAIVEKHRALVVLRCLADPALRGHANESVLSALLDEHGLGCSRDRLRACLRFLEQSELMTTSAVGDLTVAHLTHRGHEAAEGRVQIQGVLSVTVGYP